MELLDILKIPNKHLHKQRGKLDVVADDGRDIYVTLGDGAVFGEVQYLVMLLYFEMVLYVFGYGAVFGDLLYLGRCGIW